MDEENPVFSAADGILYNKAGDTLLYCPGGKGRKEFTIPAAVHTIAPRAFGECYDLCKVVIPAAVKHIGDEAFPRRTWNRPYQLTDIEVEIGAGTGSAYLPPFVICARISSSV